MDTSGTFSIIGRFNCMIINKKPKFNLGDPVQLEVSQTVGGITYYGIKKGVVVAIEAFEYNDGYFSQVGFSYSVADSIYSKENRWNEVSEKSLKLQD